MKLSGFIIQTDPDSDLFSWTRFRFTSADPIQRYFRQTTSPGFLALEVGRS
jgi:hypothetical protein